MISPNPKDKVTLEQIRELASTWLMRHFPEHEAVIICHDDNPGRILHAHVVVNNTNLKTGRRMHTDHPEDLNRDLQELAKERGLSYFSSTAPGKYWEEKRPDHQPRTRQGVHLSRAEQRIKEEGGYSWLADIRTRVEIAKHISSNEVEFKVNLDSFGVTVDESKSRRCRPDWVYGLADQPSRRVCGEKLGVLYGRYEIAAYFRRREQIKTNPTIRRGFRDYAKTAVVLNDLEDLKMLATAIALCRDYHVASIEAMDAKVQSLQKVAERSYGSLRAVRIREADELAQARDFMASRKLLPPHHAHADKDQPSPRMGRRFDAIHTPSRRQKRHARTPQQSRVRLISHSRDRSR